MFVHVTIYFYTVHTHHMTRKAVPSVYDSICKKKVLERRSISRDFFSILLSLVLMFELSIFGLLVLVLVSDSASLKKVIW